MKRRVWHVGAMSFAMVLMTGCAGRVSPTQAGVPGATTPTTTPGYTSTPSYSDPYATTPGYGSTPGYATPGFGSNYGSTPGYGSGYGTTPGTTMGMASQLTAQIESMKNGSFLGLGAFKVTVKVTNPASMPASGTLKVSIMSSGKSIKDFNEPVTVPGGQTITRTYEDKRWKADNASVSIMPTAQTMGSDPYGAYGGVASGYPATGTMGGYPY